MDDEYQDLHEYTKAELLNMAKDEGLEVSDKMLKDELVQILSEYYDQQAEELEDELPDNEEEDCQSGSLFDRQTVDRDNDMSTLDDDDITTNTDIYDKVCNPHIIVRLIRKRILHEMYNPITKTFVRVSKKRPLASKSFVSKFESRVLSFTNLNFYTGDMDYEKDIIPFAKKNLHNFNDELLNTPEINESTHMIFFDIFYNLLKSAVNNAQDGAYRDFLENLRANKTKQELYNDRAQRAGEPSPGFRDEFVGAHG